jgi:hypothetical protein
MFTYSGTNNAETLPSELHVTTTSSYNIPDASRFRYLRISQRLPIMFPRDVLDVVRTVFGKCTLPTLHAVFHFYRIISQQRARLRTAIKIHEIGCSPTETFTGEKIRLLHANYSHVKFMKKRRCLVFFSLVFPAIRN